MSDIETQTEENVPVAAPSREEATQVASELMHKLLDLMDAEITLTVGERDEVPLISLKGADESILIGRHGETLHALQMLLTLMLQKHFHGAAPEVLVDVDDYTERRRDTITQMAIRMANKAIDTGRTIELKPMPAQERRIVHMALKEYPGVSTHSTGDGEERYIVIVPGEQ